jgi:hypothetical protein
MSLLMLHTFVGSSNVAVRETVREPMKAISEAWSISIKQAAWISTFVERGAANGKSPVEIMDLRRICPMRTWTHRVRACFFRVTTRLADQPGTPERSAWSANFSSRADEIACSIDFGVDTDTVRWLTSI